MNPGATAASFFAYLGADFQMVTATTAWGSGNTILTCTPTAPLPAGYTVMWSVDGEDTFGITMDNDFDTFTVSGGGSSGTGCDAAVPMYSFTVSKGWLYQQISTASPALDTGNPYCFLACTTIPCPTGATNVSLRMPIGIEVNEKGTGIPGHLNHLDCSYATPAALDAAYGTGDYRFTVQATASNLPVTVNFPAFTQPSAPHVSNWAAAQAIDPTQPFTLTWDAMAGGTVADCIYVEIYGSVFKTPTLGEAGALTGTATSITIPANTLQPNQNYQGAITFYHYQTADEWHLSRFSGLPGFGDRVPTEHNLRQRLGVGDQQHRGRHCHGQVHLRRHLQPRANRDHRTIHQPAAEQLVTYLYDECHYFRGSHHGRPGPRQPLLSRAQGAVDLAASIQNSTG